MPDEDIASKLEAISQMLGTGQTGQPGAAIGPATATAEDDRARRMMESLSTTFGAEPQFQQVGPTPYTQSRPTRGTFEERNFRGIPIDLSLEPSADVRAGVLAREKPEDKIRFLETVKNDRGDLLFGTGNARIAEGVPLVTVWDEKRGSPVEIPALGQGFQAEDIPAHIQAMMPATLGALAGAEVMGAAKLPRFLKFAGQAIGAAVGEHAVGGLQEATVSATPLDDIIKERAQRTALSSVENAVLMGLAKPLSYAVTPLRETTTAERAGLREAVQYFVEEPKFQVQYPQTLGEKTGSTMALRTEAAMSRLPGSSKAFENIQDAKMDAFREIQRKMRAGSATPKDIQMFNLLEQDVGESAVGALQTKLDPIERAKSLAASEVERTANLEAIKEMRGTPGYGIKMEPEQVGGAIRSEVFAKRDAWKSQVAQAYDKAYSLPGGTDKILEPQSLAEKAKSLIAEQPSVEKTVTKPTGFTSLSGEPILSTTTGVEQVKEFVDPEVMRDLKALVDTKGAKFSLRDLVRMRSYVSDQIARGEAVPGVETHYLGKVRNLLTDAIDESTAALPTPELKTAWEDANRIYKQGVGQFEERNIARLFKDIESAGFIKDENIVKQIGPTEYESFKNILGANSPQFTALQRSILGGIVEDSKLPGRDMLDGAKLVNNLSRFVRDQRTIANDLLGPERVKAINQLGRLISEVGPENAPKTGWQLDAAQFADLLASGRSDLKNAMQELIGRQIEQRELFKSNALKWIADGTIGEHLDDAKFVTYYLNDASPKELKLIQEQLKDNPQALEDLRRYAIQDIFFKAQAPATRGEAVQIGSGQLFRMSDTRKLEEIFGNPQSQERLKAILGPDAFKDFEMLAKMLRPGQTGEKAFSAMGGISTGQAVAEMARGGILNYAGDFAKRWFIAFIYSNPITRTLAANQIYSGPQGAARLVRTVIATKEMKDAAVRDFGAEGANLIQNAIEDSLDLTEQRGSPQYRTLAGQDWIDRVLQEQQQRELRKQRVFPVEPRTFELNKL